MSSFQTIEKLKEEINRFKPSSEIFIAKKGYNNKLLFLRAEDVEKPVDTNKYTEIVSQSIKETLEPSVRPCFNVEETLKRIFLYSVRNIIDVVNFGLTKKNITKNRELLDWLNRKYGLFNGYGFYMSQSPEWKETRAIDTLLKVGVWLHDKGKNDELREQLTEVVKLLIIKEKENGGT